MKVKEVCDLVNGRAFKPADWGTKGVPIIRIQNLNDEDAPFNYFSGEYSQIHEINNGELLFSWSGTPGTSFGAFLWNRGKGVLNQHIFKVIPKVSVEKEYLKYALNGNLQSIIEKAHGGVGLQHITKKELDEIEIPIPSITEQKQIVKCLQQTETIIRYRKKQLLIFDNLIKARFVEMFGAKGYSALKWNDVFNTTTGKLDSNAAVENGDYPFFTCSKDILRIDKYAFDQEALLLAGNNAAGKYDVKYYKGKFNAYQRTYVLSLKGNWSYRLLQYQLEDKLIYLQQQSLGGLTKYLTLKILGELEFIIPPMELQQDFSNFVAQIDKTKEAVKKSLDKAQLLFDSLMQQYFG